MELDPLIVAPMAVTMMQHRRVAIGEPRIRIEVGGRTRAELFEMRLEMREHIRRKPQPQDVLQGFVDCVQVEPGDIGRARLLPHLVRGRSRSELHVHDLPPALRLAACKSDASRGTRPSGLVSTTTMISTP